MADTARQTALDQKEMSQSTKPALAKMNSISKAMEGVVSSTQPVTVSQEAAEVAMERKRGGAF